MTGKPKIARRQVGVGQREVDAFRGQPWERDHQLDGEAGKRVCQADDRVAQEFAATTVQWEGVCRTVGVMVW